MSYTKLRYHITTGTRNREGLITPEVQPVVYGALQNRALDLHGQLLTIGGMADHIHCLAIIPRTLPGAEFIQKIKNYSSGADNQSKVVDYHFNWQAGYGAFTVNPYDMKEIVQYINHQAWHHANNSLIEEYEKTDF